MLIELDILDPIINITNRETALINAHIAVFSNIEHMLCVWHINKNVLGNYKKHFEIKKD